MKKEDQNYLAKTKQLRLQSQAEGLSIPFEEEIYEKLENIYFYGLPASILIKFKRFCQNKCYERSMLLLAAFDDCLLIRANIRPLEILFSKEEAGHGWVEKDGWVYDTTFGEKFPKDLYYEMFEPSNIVSYSKKEYEQKPIYKEAITTQVDPNILLMVMPLIEEMGELTNDDKLKADVKKLKISTNYDIHYENFKEDFEIKCQKQLKM